MNSILALTKELIQIQSVTGKSKEALSCFLRIENQFSDMINARIESGDGYLIVKNFDGKHAHIVLNGHVDVVAGDKSQFEPYEKDGKLYGRGSGDMKAGVALITMLMKELLEQNYTKKNVMMILTADEETGGPTMEKLVNEQGYGGDIVLIPDGGSTTEIALIQKGVLHLTVETSGVACHSSRPWLGENAVHNLVNFFITIREELQDTEKAYFSDDHRGTTVNLNVVKAGEAINAVPDKALGLIDIRFTEKYKLETVRKLVIDNMPSFNCRIVSEIGGDLMFNSPTNSKVLQYKEIASSVVGKELHFIKEHGGSDGRYFSAQGSITILHRPDCGNIHGADEWVDIASIDTIYQCYKAFVVS